MSFTVSFSAASSLADPPQTSVLVPAVAWLQGTLLGTTATIIAVLAISAIGFMMLSGRLAVRPALATVVGCFILFGAANIAAGISSSAGASGSAPIAMSVEPILSIDGPQLTEPVSPSSGTSDPYAGATLPPE